MFIKEEYEDNTRFNPILPIIVRIDGRNFSKFTKDLITPYDERFSELMIEVTKILIDETDSNLAYTQSDEINLIIWNKDIYKQVYFSGKIQKIISVISSVTTGNFNELRKKYLPNYKESKICYFDCRAFQVNDTEDITKYLIWRRSDAFRNSLFRICREYYSSKELLNKSNKDRIELLNKKNINLRSFNPYFLQGIYLKKVKVLKDLSSIDNIPEKYRSDRKVERREIKYIDANIKRKDYSLLYKRTSWDMIYE